MSPKSNPGGKKAFAVVERNTVGGGILRMRYHPGQYQVFMQFGLGQEAFTLIGGQ